MSIEWPIVLEGGCVRLEPLTVQHAAALCRATAPGTFDYFLVGPPTWDEAGFSELIRGWTAYPTVRAFVVIDRRTGSAVGSTSYCDIDAKHRCIEVGHTWYARSSQGTAINPQCKLLLLEHAFGPLFGGKPAERVTLKCDARNLQSQRAITGIGAVREGVLRKQRIQANGFVRDTVYFGVTRDDWPGVRERLRCRLGALEAAEREREPGATTAHEGPPVPNPPHAREE